jgi:hypothetical protein
MQYVRVVFLRDDVSLSVYGVAVLRREWSDCLVGRRKQGAAQRWPMLGNRIVFDEEAILCSC